MRWMIFGPLLVSAGCLQAKDPNADADGDSDVDADSDSDGDACNGRTGNELGDAFEGFEFPDCTGTARTFDEVEGDALLFNVSAGWCGPCRKETPDFQTYYAAHRSGGVAIVQVLYQDDGGQPATSAFCEDWTDEYGLTYLVLFDPIGQTALYFDNPSTQMPLNIVVDRQGCVTLRAIGTEGGFGTISEALAEAL